MPFTGLDEVNDLLNNIRAMNARVSRGEIPVFSVESMLQDVYYICSNMDGYNYEGLALVDVTEGEIFRHGDPDRALNAYTRALSAMTIYPFDDDPDSRRQIDLIRQTLWTRFELARQVGIPGEILAAATLALDGQAYATYVTVDNQRGVSWEAVAVKGFWKRLQLKRFLFFDFTRAVMR